MTIRSRLTRLLGSKKHAHRKSMVSDAVTVRLEESSVSSDDVSYQQHVVDPYADVRAAMEARAAAQGDAKQEPEIPRIIAFSVYLSYAVLILLGHVRDLCAMVFGGRFHTTKKGDRRAPLLKSWEHFYTRRLYTRVQDAFNRPICSNPGASISVCERVSYDGLKSMDLADDSFVASRQHASTDSTKTVARDCINLGSYNYLGFADDWQETCAAPVQSSLDALPISTQSNLREYGTTKLHQELESTVASFLGKPSALVLNMGFNTNATVLPALCRRGDLIVSDALNHTSIVNGARASGAAISIFAHNDMEALENILKKAVLMGQPRSRRPFRKVVVVVEGIYSMEGEYANLRAIVALCKKYGAYSYLDEAHSIGAMGATGRGVTEYLGIDTKDVDILMGTFTKSFGGMGGYVCGDKHVIAHLRTACAGSSAHNSLSPVVCQQVLTAFKVRKMNTQC